MDEKTPKLTVAQINLVAHMATNSEIQRMLNDARDYFKEWDSPSNFSERITKRAMYDFIIQAWDVNKEYRYSSKVIFISEFGEFF